MESSCSWLAGRAWAGPAIVSLGNPDRASLWPPISIDPRGRSATIAEADAGSATLEIVPLLAVEGPEKFRVVQPVQLPADTAPTLDESGIAAKVEELSPHPPFTQERRRAREPPVPIVAAHQRAVGEEEG
jgi:hypothetical protein